MKNTSKLVTAICEIGIFAALGFVFDELQGIIFKSVFPNGGSIGFAMIAVLIIAYRRGLIPALLTGLIMGLFDIATSAYIIHPVQLFLDYILPYAFVGLIGLLKPLFDKNPDKKSQILWLIAGAVIGGLLKFICHYTAGVFFWAHPDEFAWGLETMNVYLYCFVYNIAFIGPSIILTGALFVAIYLRAPQLFIPKYDAADARLKNVINPTKIILSSSAIAVGLFFFVFFIIKYTKSFSDYSYVDEYGNNVYGYDFDPDFMMLFILGFFLLVMGINNLVKYFKDRFTFVSYSGALFGIVLASFIYGLTRLIRMYVKEKDPTDYWIWLIVSLVLLAGAATFFVLSIIQKKKASKKELDVTPSDLA